MSEFAGNSSEVSGHSTAARTSRDSMIANDPTGNFSGQTYKNNDSQRLVDSYEAIFGPAGRDIKHDPQRHKRHQRWHLPDNLKGRNEYLTDRVDGLITDATSSPFTRNILPYVYLDSPDQKIKWNVYSFDEGMASRVPYESAARVLTQSKTSHAGYAVRQGLAIVMEHNFLASAAGMANFKNQLKQVVGSIQLPHDLDVHIALLQAQSYQKTINEKYYSENDTLYDVARRYVDMFGVMQKMPNALDILIEDAKNHLKTWGSQPPTFLLCPSDLTAQLQMNPERTNYITNGPDGLKRLAQGPDLPSYRGLSIIHSQKFSLEPGRKPRNVLKRRVRVAEYYWIPLGGVNSYQIYNQKKDMMVTFDRTHALKASCLDTLTLSQTFLTKPYFKHFKSHDIVSWLQDGYCLLIRPNIEHEMLTIIAGRGGTQELGATFWGQTELACYDDAQHGIWGMSYKYHERAIVTNERNLIRMFDVAFDGYGGGMDTDIVKISELENYTKDTYNNEPGFKGKSVIALHFPRYLPARPIENGLMNMILEIFLCDPDKRQSTDLNTSELQFHKKMLSKIYDALGTLVTTEIEDILEEEKKQAPDQDKIDASKENISDWALDISVLIISLVKTYQELRPNEDPTTLYQRILKCVHRTFVSDIVPMLPATMNNILTRLKMVCTDPNIKSEEFSNALKSLLIVMMLRWPFTENPHAANLINISNIRGELQGNASNIARYYIFLTSGFVISNPVQDCNNWTLQRNGTTPNYADARTSTLVGVDEIWRSLKSKYSNYQTEKEYLKDYQYFIHCMQKPAFEVPNPVILGTFLGQQTIPQSFVTDPEASEMLDRNRHHDFAYQIQNFFDDDSPYTEQKNAMKELLQHIFEKYRNDASYLWTSNNKIPASTYMQNSTTELPSLAYHGNLYIDRQSGREDIRCVGHLGNSFPGCACIRQGKGMLNMYERPPTAIHVI
jgi:hypothetical protein